MPRATDDLRAMFASDEVALDALGFDKNCLSERFTMMNFTIIPKAGVKPTPHELCAVDYLFQEWDYGFDFQ